MLGMLSEIRFEWKIIYIKVHMNFVFVTLVLHTYNFIIVMSLIRVKYSMYISSFWGIRNKFILRGDGNRVNFPFYLFPRTKIELRTEKCSLRALLRYSSISCYLSSPSMKSRAVSTMAQRVPAFSTAHMLMYKALNLEHRCVFKLFIQNVVYFYV